MAEISLAIGTSHAPQLGTPPEQWGERARADRGNPALVYRGKEYPYGALRDLRQAAFAGDCELDVWRRRHTASRAAIAALGKAVHDAHVDVLVIVSSRAFLLLIIASHLGARLVHPWRGQIQAAGHR